MRAPRPGWQGRRTCKFRFSHKFLNQIQRKFLNQIQRKFLDKDLLNKCRIIGEPRKLDYGEQGVQVCLSWAETKVDFNCILFFRYKTELDIHSGNQHWGKLLSYLSGHFLNLLHNVETHSTANCQCEMNVCVRVVWVNTSQWTNLSANIRPRYSKTRPRYRDETGEWEVPLFIPWVLFLMYSTSEEKSLAP